MKIHSVDGTHYNIRSYSPDGQGSTITLIQDRRSPHKWRQIYMYQLTNLGKSNTPILSEDINKYTGCDYDGRGRGRGLGRGRGRGHGRGGRGGGE